MSEVPYFQFGLAVSGHPGNQRTNCHTSVTQLAGTWGGVPCRRTGSRKGVETSTSVSLRHRIVTEPLQKPYFQHRTGHGNGEKLLHFLAESGGQRRPQSSWSAERTQVGSDRIQ